MASTVTNRISESKASITISGRFDFSTHRDFRASYEQILSAGTVHELDVDLKGVDYVDSSALGMLLLLREKSLAQHIKLKLVGTQSDVRQILDVANFGRLFTIT